MENKVVVDIFDYKLENAENIKNAFEFLSDKYLISQDKQQRLRDKLKKLLSKFRMLYQQMSRKRDLFEQKCSNWLQTDFCIEEFIQEDNATTSSSAGKRGRPRKSFLDLSSRSKRRNIEKKDEARELHQSTLMK